MDSSIKALKIDYKPFSWWYKIYLRFYEWKQSLPGHYWRHELYWKLRSYVIPQHQELRKVVPKTWADLPGIIEDFLCECIISHVEKEKCFETVVWEGDEEKELRDLYDFAKWRRHEMAVARDQYLHEWYAASKWAKGGFLDPVVLSPEESAEERRLFEEGNVMEAEHTRIMTDYLTRIIKIRDRLWV